MCNCTSEFDASHRPGMTDQSYIVVPSTQGANSAPPKWEISPGRRAEGPIHFKHASPSRRAMRPSYASDRLFCHRRLADEGFVRPG
jgi:hypothetical protein